MHIGAARRRIVDPIHAASEKGLGDSPQRRRLQSHPQIIQALRRREGALGQVDLNPELGTESKKEVPRPNDLLQGGSKDQPIV